MPKKTRLARGAARSADAPSRRPSSRGLRLRVAILVATGILTYWNSLQNPFIIDDRNSIVENRQIRELWPPWSALSPRQDTPVAGRPIVNLSFAVNYAFGELEVAGYHAVNIGIHLLAALTLLGCVRRTLDLPVLAGRFGSASIALAWASALIWMLHPLQTEVVDYLTQRTESLMGLFYLLTLYCSIRSIQSFNHPIIQSSNRPIIPSSNWTLAAVLACGLGMACKESMVTAPVMIALYDRVFLFDSLKRALKVRWPLYAGLSATWVELAALMWQGPRTSIGFSAGVDSLTYLFNQAEMIVRYLWLAIWPRALVLDYGLPQPLTLTDVLPEALLILCLLLLTVAAVFFRPRIGFLGTWFWLTLAPTSSLVPIATEVGAERRMYLPLAALLVLVVIAVRLLYDRLGPLTRPSAPLSPRRGESWDEGKPRATKAVGMICLAGVCALAAAGSIQRNAEYASGLSIARTIVERHPQGRGHFLLGSELVTAGAREEALAHFRESARDYPGALYALGTEHIAQGDTEQGLKYLYAFIRALPSHANVALARQMIGLTLISQRKLEEAAEQFNRILKDAPQFTDARAHLADIRLEQERFEEAIAHYEAFLKQRPRSARAQTGLGIALASSGRLDEAIRAFQRAIEADPSALDAHRSLANAFLDKRDSTQAAAHARRALQLRPDDPVAHNLLGLSLAFEQKLDEAIAEFRRALEIQPGYTEARNNLALAVRMRAEQGGR